MPERGQRALALSWCRFAIENIEFSEQSRELVRGQFSEKRMGVRAYEDVSQRAADISAQQLIAQGVRDNGLGDGGAMVFGMNLPGRLTLGMPRW